MGSLVYRHWHEGLNPDECVSVDGDAPGRLHLSHWPGNRTPVALRSDLSTGSCLQLNKQPDREQLLAGITTVTNNHWDTDGLLSAFVLLNPELAREHAPLLYSAAMSGDFDLFTTPEAVKINLTLTALSKHKFSPVRTGLYGTALEARQAQYEYGLKLMSKLLENPELHADWIAQEFWAIMRDMRAIREDKVRIKHIEHADMVVVTGDRHYHTMAVNTSADVGRVLTVVTLERGWLYEFRFTTRSWFDMVTRPLRRPRGDLARAARLLNHLAPGYGGIWVADDPEEPLARLCFQDPQGNLVPNETRPVDVTNLILSGTWVPDPRLDALAQRPPGADVGPENARVEPKTGS